MSTQCPDCNGVGSYEASRDEIVFCETCDGHGHMQPAQVARNVDERLMPGRVGDARVFAKNLCASPRLNNELGETIIALIDEHKGLRAENERLRRVVEKFRAWTTTPPNTEDEFNALTEVTEALSALDAWEAEQCKS